MASERRRRIGYFSLDISNTFNELMLKGVTDAAEEEDTDIFVVHGGQLRSPQHFEASRNELYQLIQADQLDGLLLPDIFAFLEQDERSEFLIPFANLPKVTIGHIIPGLPHVNVRNSTGFEALVQHLIDQGCNRIAVITGPRLSIDTQERMETLVSVLDKQGQKLSPDLIYEGDYSYLSGTLGVTELLDTRHQHFEALICFNDNMAMAAMDELRRRGIHIPDEIKVTGFDNTEESQNLTPPLTTVNFPIYELGKTGLKLLVASLRGQTIASNTWLNSKFIHRRSTGAWEDDDIWQTPLPPDLEAVVPLTAGATEPRRPPATDFEPAGVLLDHLMKTYAAETRGVLDAQHLTKVRAFIENNIWLSFQALRTGSFGGFLTNVQSQLNSILNQNWDVTPWQAVFSLMGQTFIQKSAGQYYQLLQLMFSEAVSFARNKKKLAIINEKILDRLRTEKLLELGEALGTAFDSRVILNLLAERLPELHLTTCYLVLFVPETGGRQAYLALELRQGHLVRHPRTEFNATEILPRNLLDHHNSLLMDCLHIKDDLLGYIIYNVPTRPGLMFKMLRHQISTAMLATSLMTQVNNHAQILEAKIKERTRELEVANLKLQKEMHERELMEKELLRQKNLESLGLLAGGIAHDFNNLLTGIMGNVSLMELGLSAEETTACLSDIMKALERSKSLTQQLLTFSRGGAPVKSRASLKELIEETSRFSLRGGTIIPVYHFAESLWPVEVDQSQISQVLNNLIINAKQAMPEGGRLTFTAENHNQAAPRPGLAAGDYVCLSISDQGHGMAAEVLEKIFEPYFTTKVHGNGLGLATSLNIIRRHGGDLTAQSDLGNGTTFRIYLPRSHQIVEDAPKPRSSSLPTPTGRRHFLVLDDELPILNLLKRILSAMGHQVTVTAEGSQTILEWEAARTAGRSFDALILDITVPGGMGGLEVLQKIQAVDASVKALVSSGYSDSSVMADFKTFGFSGILKKPYTVKEVATALDDLFPK